MLIYEKTNIPPLRFTITLRQLDNLIHQIRNGIYILIVVYEKKTSSSLACIVQEYYNTYIAKNKARKLGANFLLSFSGGVATSTAV